MIGQRRNTRPDRIIGALDIGTTKVCCLIMACDASEQKRLLGFGHQRMHGIKAGVVIDPERAERAVRAAVAQAESMAGVTLGQVYVAVTCGRLKSESFVARATIRDRVVARGDIDRVLSGGEAYATRDGRTIVQLTDGGWCLDGLPGTHNPLGMSGGELSLPMHAVTVDESPLNNLLHVIDRCHLEAEGVVVAPFASALAATTAEERELGVLCVDLGGGTTTMAAFADGQFIFADGLPIGGGHVTSDIARALSTPLAEAERIKTLYGTLLPAYSDEREVISFPSAEEDETQFYQTSKARLRTIIEPRIEMLWGLLGERLAQAGLETLDRGRVVLTGGASQLVGFAEWWSSRTGGTVRVGRARPVGGMPESMWSPAFAAATGLGLSALSPASGVAARRTRAVPQGGYFGRLHGWIRDSF